MSSWFRPKPRPSPPPPPIPWQAVWHVYVRDSQTGKPPANAIVYFNGQAHLTNADGYAGALLSMGINGIVIKADHYREKIVDVNLQHELESVYFIEPLVQTLQRLHTNGPIFMKEDGTRWNWQGVSAFSLAYDIATGQEPKVIAFLDWCVANDVTIVRVFTTAVNMFDLDPGTGRDAAGRILQLARDRGLYVELVGLADTAQRAFDHRDHLDRLGDLALRYTNSLIEIANEPNHETQAPEAKDPIYLLSLGNMVPAEVPLSSGASHGADDENPIYWHLDYATVHGDRKGGWDSVRHTREMQRIRDNGHVMPVVNDEPDRNLTSDQHLGMSLLCRIFSLGDTVHLAGLRYSQIPQGDELLAFNARQRGWNAVPKDWTGRYSRATLAGDPIVSLDDSQVLRAYSSLRENEGYVVGLGVKSDSSIRFGNGWSGTFQIDEGQARLWHVTR